MGGASLVLKGKLVMRTPWCGFRFVSVMCVSVVLAGCAVGPDYQRPGIDVGAQYRQNQGWTQVGQTELSLRADWWRLFNDPVLDDLMQDVLVSNQTIAQVDARYRQAQATLSATRSEFFPVVAVGADVTRSRSGQSEPRRDYALSGVVSWEADVWGRIRRGVEADRAQMSASEADLAATRLSVQSVLAQTYFQLRASDAERRLLDQTIAAYERSLQITRNRLAAGVVSQLDVSSSQTQLENARAQKLALQRQRMQLENALAVLLGKVPSQFRLEEAQVMVDVPAIPAALPSQVLERRPDVVAAERRMVAANAEIGVAQAAWFPDLVLSAQGGFRSGQWAQWLTAPFSFWSVGPALAMTLFDGGTRSARVDEARALYDSSVAAWRQTVLTALQEVEDYLVALDSLQQEQSTQGRALAAARESLRLTRNQYDAGLIDYLSVVQVETSALSAEREAIGLGADRLIASVQLMVALGGGWQGVTPVATSPSPRLIGLGQ